MELKKSTNILDLPNEILEKIFNLLPKESSVPVLSRVCRRFRSISGQAAILDFDRLSLLEGFVYHLQSATDIVEMNYTVLTIKNIKNGQWLSKSKQHHQKEEHDNARGKTLAKILELCAPTLNVLLLNGERLRAFHPFFRRGREAPCRFWTEILDMFQNLPRLEKLDASQIVLTSRDDCCQCQQNSEENTILPNLFRNCAKLNDIHFGCLIQDGREVEQVLTGLASHAKSLTSLQFGDCTNYENTMPAPPIKGANIWQALKKLTRLRYPVREETMGHFVNAGNFSTGLTHLILDMRCNWSIVPQKCKNDSCLTTSTYPSVKTLEINAPHRSWDDALPQDWLRMFPNLERLHLKLFNDLGVLNQVTLLNDIGGHDCTRNYERLTKTLLDSLPCQEKIRQLTVEDHPTWDLEHIKHIFAMVIGFFLILTWLVGAVISIGCFLAFWLVYTVSLFCLFVFTGGFCIF